MTEEKVEKVVDELSDKALDDWYDEEEDQSAEDTVTTTESSSSTEEDTEDSPDPKDPISDASDKEALDDGNSSQQTTKESDPYAWIGQLDPEIKKQAEALVHRDLSNSGRVAALQSRLDKQTAQMDAAQSASLDRRQKAVEQVTEDKAEDEGLNEFIEEFPAVASNVKKLIEQGIAKEREEIMGQVRPLQEDITRNRIQQERSYLRERAAQIFNTAETGIQLEDVTGSQAFKDWMTSKPEGYRTYATKSTSAEDAANVLSDFAIYAEDMMYTNWQKEQDQQTTESTSEADRLAERRKSALSANSPTSESATIDDGNLGSYEAHFDRAVSEG